MFLFSNTKRQKVTKKPSLEERRSSSCYIVTVRECNLQDPDCRLDLIYYEASLDLAHFGSRCSSSFSGDNISSLRVSLLPKIN